jgi:hypothetical protein
MHEESHSQISESKLEWRSVEESESVGFCLKVGESVQSAKRERGGRESEINSPP